MIWFFHSGGTEASLSSADRATADSAPVDISAAARRKIPSNRGLRMLQPKLNDDVHMTAHLAAGDVRARYSLAGASPVFGRHARPARQVRRTPADPPVTRAGAARSTPCVDCHGRLNVRKLLGNAQ